MHWVGHEPGWCPDDDGSTDPVHALLAKYGETFLAHRPGLRRNLLDRSFRGLSATQWEAYLALHHSKPLFVFQFLDSAERHTDFLASAPTPERLSQAEHLEILRKTNFDRTESVRDQHHFKEAAIAALVRGGIITKIESLPPPRTSEFTTIGTLFMGRVEKMKELRNSLRGTAKATALVAQNVIHGQGGIGKTRLAIEFGLAHAAEYSALLFVGADSP